MEEIALLVTNDTVISRFAVLSSSGKIRPAGIALSSASGIIALFDVEGFGLVPKSSVFGNSARQPSKKKEKTQISGHE